MSIAMPTSNAKPFSSPVVRSRDSVSMRDTRLDFFRGLALLMIFIDHVAGNGLAAYTLHSLGFADAAEVFVFIAGLAGVYAYRSTILNKGLAAGFASVMMRVRQLYLAHLLMVGGVLLLAMAVLLSNSSFDIIGKLGLRPLLDDPAAAITLLPVLAYLPHYLDILPLYIVLFSALPLIVLGLKRHPLLPAAIALLFYGAAQGFGLNLPNLGQGSGWFLNPFAWGLLFVLGATTAELTIRDVWSRLPRLLVAAITAAAATYVVMAFLQAAPWQASALFRDWTAVALPIEPNKTLLSWHRLLDILAKAWLVAVLVPRGAEFMTTALGGAISRAGRRSLPVFVAGTFLSVVGSVILHETGGAIGWQVVVNLGGIALLLAYAWLLDGKADKTRKPAAPQIAGRSSLSAS